MTQSIDRKIKINSWILFARYFYILGFVLVGSLTKIISQNRFNMPYSIIFMLGLIAVLFNLFIYLLLYFVKKYKTDFLVTTISIFQVVYEVIILTVTFYFSGGLEGIVSFFFLIPIVFSSFLFDIIGSVITAFFVGIFLTGTVILGYFGVIPHIYRYGIEPLEYTDLSVSLAKILTISFFYLIVAIFSGFFTRILYSREDLLAQKTEEASISNEQLAQKIEDLKRSEQSMLKAFRDLKNERQKLEEEQDKTVAIISNFIDPIIVINKESHISLINPSAREIFGFIGSDLGVKINPLNNYSMDNFRAIIKKEFKVKSSKELKSSNSNEEEVIINYNNQEYTYKVITEKIYDNQNQYLGIMKVFYNLTREKMIDKMKSEFISIAAHQLRTPLSAIKWVVKMVLDGDVGALNDEQKNFLLKGYQSNERIIEMVNDMLNVSRIEEGRFAYSFSTDKIDETLAIVVDCLTNRIREKNLNLTIDKPEKLPEVYMDKQKMNLVLQNLLENAVKYTPEHGSIKVTIKNETDYLMISIKDNGVGIPESDKAKLFTKFFRASNVMRMQTEGTGLGLFIIKSIIEKHGGTITYKSEEGVGTEFIFTMPLSQALRA